VRAKRGLQSSLTLDRFLRLVALEEKRGYDNKAATGGTDRVVLGWLTAACERSRTPSSRCRLSDLAAVWREYCDASAGRRAEIVAATRHFLESITTPRLESPASPVAGLPGIGPARAFALAGIGILTVEDLLLFAPVRYLDCLRVGCVADLCDGTTATLEVRLLRNPRLFPGPKASRVEAPASDGTGKVILVWFNQPYRSNQFSMDDWVTVAGRASVRQQRTFFVVSKTLSHARSQAACAEAPNPLPASGLLAEYAGPRGLPSRVLRQAIAAALSATADGFQPIIPSQTAARLGLFTRPEVFRALHQPQDLTETEKAAQSLAFERLLLLQLRLLLHRSQALRTASQSRVEVAHLPERIEALSGLRLTDAQRRVIREIEEDLKSSRPACRLIHGDVGCGKTLVAAAALVGAAAAGRQAAIMAPTEALAEQHFARLRTILEPAGIPAFLLTGSLPEAHRAPALEAAAAGRPGVWMGTHALIQERVTFADLAVVVVDEQHRFGVAQRARLAAKGYAPNFFAMSATPIPRTLALALYADFDLSVIDELPPGRQPVQTRLIEPQFRPAAYAALRRVVEAGRQAFVVCPCIEPSQAMEAEAASHLVEQLRKGPLAGLRLGLVHGRMATQDRQAIMAAFYQGHLDVLVSTTVIEVGLDVPNASVILVENAERFGLAQLHQLRGRVARSRHRPLCLLVKGTGGQEANQRLDVLARTQDGFRIAEADLKLRGAGELAGLRQHGMGDWVVGDVVRYPQLLVAAHDEAAGILAADPELSQRHNELLAQGVAGLGELEEGSWAL